MLFKLMAEGGWIVVEGWTIKLFIQCVVKPLALAMGSVNRHSQVIRQQTLARAFASSNPVAKIKFAAMVEWQTQGT